jgi:hypothetical protein
LETALLTEIEDTIRPSGVRDEKSICKSQIFQTAKTFHSRQFKRETSLPDELRIFDKESCALWL